MKIIKFLTNSQLYYLERDASVLFSIHVSRTPA